MNDLDKSIFKDLFREVCLKGFDFPLTSTLTETDSRLLSNKIFEKTGLVIGPKSLKNYSFFVINSESREAGDENPSVATLDTLARYVLDAPYTDEVKRKNYEGHFPYWFQYRSRFSQIKPERKYLINKSKRRAIFGITLLIAVICFFIIMFYQKNNPGKVFFDNFNSVSNDSLKSRGWILKSTDNEWWPRHTEKPGHLALYTLKGDNWANSDNEPLIKNLLIRKISSDCFMAETHITDFFPTENWQQAGILLLEDSTFRGKMLRLSISYNDFFGGYNKPPEIIIQAIGSSEAGLQSKPEEIGHITLFSIDPERKNLVKSNLSQSALKIEKTGNHFRFLYFIGPKEGFAFKEAVSGNFDIEPKYAGIFAIKGWSESQNLMAVYFDSFSLVSLPCKK